MKCEIFIVSYAKHFLWLHYCLLSIGKHATGFSGVTLIVPDIDEPMAKAMFPGIIIKSGKEWEGKGMLWHMAQVMRADEWCPHADFILHTDSDCVFSEPVTPEDYFKGGKPVLMHATFKWLTKQQANLEMWRTAAEKALGWSVDREFMRRHPAVHYRKVYKTARERIEIHTKMPCDEYIKSCENGFPQTFAEYPTIGAVAWRHFHPDYSWRDQETDGFPPSKIVQFWGHQAPAIPQKPVYKGEPFECTPEYFVQ